MAGYDAIDGYTDTDAQKAAFGLSDDDAVSTQQKSAYATANVLDMGGLVSGATNPDRQRDFCVRLRKGW